MASKSGVSVAEKAFRYLRYSPRITPHYIQDNPGARTQGRQVRAKYNKCGGSHRELQQAAKPPLGWIYGDMYLPWLRIWPPDKTYNANAHIKREYPPLSLLELQRLIDLGWLDVEQPIDLTSLCNTKQYRCSPMERQFGVQLTDEGSDVFKAKINIEVQWASEAAIAAIERNGGVITTAYYDPISLDALVDPMKFFAKGEPIPKRGFPPVDCIEYYIDVKSRGYLSNPAKLDDCRHELAQKYGYDLPDVKQDPLYEKLFIMKKDPLQVFHGLSPGWIVNLADECVLKPTDEKLLQYYLT